MQTRLSGTTSGAISRVGGGRGGALGTIRTIVFLGLVGDQWDDERDPVGGGIYMKVKYIGSFAVVWNGMCSQATLRIKNIYVIKEANFFFFFLQNKPWTALKIPH